MSRGVELFQPPFARLMALAWQQAALPMQVNERFLSSLRYMYRACRFSVEVFEYSV